MNNNSLKIGFVVNTTGLTGGIKVVFEYANYLQKRGHQVYIIHLLQLESSPASFIKGKLKQLKYIFNNKVAWFPLDKSIKILHTTNLNHLPKLDKIIATANETADFVAKINLPDNDKYYFIQDYEIWTREKKLVDTTYKLPLKKIVISSWLKNLLKEKFNEEVEKVIVNGVDFDRFKQPTKSFHREKQILMLYHFLPKKGIQYGLEAFKIAQKKHPEINLVLFGVYDPKEPLPDRTTFIKNPMPDLLVKLYQQADIFVSPSLQEGCQLPPMEAMAAQCAVVATNVGGIPDYAINKKTAIVVPPANADKLADGIIKLIEDEDILRETAKAGFDYIQNFTWDKATDLFEETLKG